MTSKTSEIGAAGKAIETKTARVGQVAVEIVQVGADKKATEKAVAEDIEFKANLGKMCAIKQKEMDERRKLRAQELEALSDTIKMLNSDDALELFKKSVPSAASFLQTASTSRSQMRSKMRRVKSLIQDAMSADKAHSRNQHLMLLALSSSTGGFEKVVGMVDGMVGVLEEEQVGDDKTEAWCKAELDKAEGELKTTEVDLETIRATIDETRDAIASTTSEIEALKAGLVELDKSVAEATEQRKTEHAEMIEVVAGNQAAVELLGMAKNRLNKFYNPSLYKEPEKKDDEDLLEISTGRAAPRPPPERPSGEYKKSESSSGVIAMIDEMVNDVEYDIATAKRDEEEAQKDYEEAMNDAATKRSDDSKLIVTKEGEKAEKTGKLEESKEAKRTKSGQLDVLESKIANTHKVCDFLMAEYAKIKEERTKEEEGLKASKQVLAGAKSFLQH